MLCDKLYFNLLMSENFIKIKTILSYRYLSTYHISSLLRVNKYFRCQLYINIINMNTILYSHHFVKVFDKSSEKKIRRKIKTVLDFKMNR